MQPMKPTPKLSNHRSKVYLTASWWILPVLVLLVACTHKSPTPTGTLPRTSTRKATASPTWVATLAVPHTPTVTPTATPTATATPHRCERCDSNGDQVVNWLDVAPFSAAYGSRPGDPNWKQQYDFTGDGVINFRDLAYFSNCYTSSWAPTPTPTP